MNEQLYLICFQLNEGIQHQFDHDYAFNHILANKNNEPEP